MPRILLISEVIPEMNFAGSILLFRLFEDYPLDRLLVLGPQPQDSRKILPCAYSMLRDSFGRLGRTRFSRLFYSLKAFSFGEIPLRRIRRVSRDYMPALVISVMQNASFYGAAARFAKELQVPLVLIVHDPPEAFEPGFSWGAVQIRNRNAAIYRAAATRLCVSPEMRDLLRERYGADGEVLYPNRCSDLKPREFVEAGQLRDSNRLTVGYAGSLNYGYDLQLREMMPAFRAAGGHLRVYAKDRNLGPESAHLSYAGFASTPLETWERVKQECDVVILPYHWDKGFTQVYAYHFPSKLTEYLALGLPALVVGPDYATGVRWALRNAGAVLTITERNEAAWIEALVRLRDEPGLRQSLAREGFAVGNRDFNPRQIKEFFLRRLEETSRSTLYELATVC